MAAKVAPSTPVHPYPDFTGPSRRIDTADGARAHGRARSAARWYAVLRSCL